MKKIAAIILAGLFAVGLMISDGNLFAAGEEDTREMQLQEEEKESAYEKEDENMLKDEEMKEEKESGEEEKDAPDEKEKDEHR